jgi:hypothetical protein
MLAGCGPEQAEVLPDEDEILSQDIPPIRQEDPFQYVNDPLGVERIEGVEPATELPEPLELPGESQPPVPSSPADRP